MTGLTDDQRADFKLMKAFTTASAPTPPERIKALQRYFLYHTHFLEDSLLMVIWNIYLTYKDNNFEGID